jgi:small conductance mechanosensitive channel
VVVLAQLGVQVGPLIAGVSVTGFIIGFAFQDTLSNFAAGLMLLANSPFKVGNFVEVNGHSGVVRELNIVATVLTTPDNKRLTIPNKLVWGSTITNFTALDTRRVDMTVAISYGSDINKAREIIKQVLAEDDRVLKDPAPTVEVMSLADSSVNFVVRPWSKTTDYWALYFSTMQKVKERLAANGVEIPFPQRVVHIVNKNG